MVNLSSLVDTRPGFRNLTGTAAGATSGGALNVSSSQSRSLLFGDKFVRNLGSGAYDVVDPLANLFPTDGAADYTATQPEGFVLKASTVGGKRKYSWANTDASWLASVLPESGLTAAENGKYFRVVQDSAGKYTFKFEPDAPLHSVEWLVCGRTTGFPAEGYISAYTHDYETTGWLAFTAGELIDRIISYSLIPYGANGTSGQTATVSGVARYDDLLNILGTPSPMAQRSIKFHFNTNQVIGRYILRAQVTFQTDVDKVPNWIESPVINVEAPFTNVTISPTVAQTNVLTTVTMSFPHAFQWQATSRIWMEYTKASDETKVTDELPATKSGNTLTFTAPYNLVKTSTDAKFGVYGVLDENYYRVYDFPITSSVTVFDSSAATFSNWESATGWHNPTIYDNVLASNYIQQYNMKAYFNKPIFLTNSQTITAASGTIASGSLAAGTNWVSFRWTPANSPGPDGSNIPEFFLPPLRSFTFTLNTLPSQTSGFTVTVNAPSLHNVVKSATWPLRVGQTVANAKLAFPAAATIATIVPQYLDDPNATFGMTGLTSFTQANSPHDGFAYSGQHAVLTFPSISTVGASAYRAYKFLVTGTDQFGTAFTNMPIFFGERFDPAV